MYGSVTMVRYMVMILHIATLLLGAQHNKSWHIEANNRDSTTTIHLQSLIKTCNSHPIFIMDDVVHVIGHVGQCYYK